MARPRSKQAPSNSGGPRGQILVTVLGLLGMGAALFAFIRKPASVTAVPQGAPGSQASAAAAGPATNALATMDVNTAVMVTVELDFGGPPPSIAEAITQIERRHQPDTGSGRTFAILDAYGEPTADGKKLHMSMHVSSEKPGVGSLIFKRTGETLWKSRIVASPEAKATGFTGGALTIFFDNGNGGILTIDGSKNPPTILDADIKEAGRPLRDLWDDGAEREMTFIYSACGCPVKVMARRTGEITARTKATPVIFPDDPAVVQVIHRLMGW